MLSHVCSLLLEKHPWEPNHVATSARVWCLVKGTAQGVAAEVVCSTSLDCEGPVASKSKPKRRKRLKRLKIPVKLGHNLVCSEATLPLLDRKEELEAMLCLPRSSCAHPSDTARL